MVESEASEAAVEAAADAAVEAGVEPLAEPDFDEDGYPSASDEPADRRRVAAAPRPQTVEIYAYLFTNDGKSVYMFLLRGHRICR